MVNKLEPLKLIVKIVSQKNRHFIPLLLTRLMSKTSNSFHLLWWLEVPRTPCFLYPILYLFVITEFDNNGNKELPIRCFSHLPDILHFRYKWNLEIPSVLRKSDIYLFEKCISYKCSTVSLLTVLVNTLFCFISILLYVDKSNVVSSVILKTSRETFLRLCKHLNIIRDSTRLNHVLVFLLTSIIILDSYFFWID